MPNLLGGTHVIRQGGSIFIPMPPEATRLIDGGCACDHCKMPNAPPARWDTLAISAKAPKGHDSATLVHAPEMHLANVQCPCARCVYWREHRHDPEPRKGGKP